MVPYLPSVRETHKEATRRTHKAVRVFFPVKGEKRSEMRSVLQIGFLDSFCSLFFASSLKRYTVEETKRITDISTSLL